MYLIFASWCERFLLWRNFFFILSALFSYFVASLSFSLVCRSEKAPRPFCFFFDFLPFSYRHRGPDGSRKGPKSCCCSSWSHRLQKSKKGKNQDNSFFGLVFKAVLSVSSTKPLVFGLRAEKFHRDEKNHILTHALQLQRKMSFAVSSFVGTRVVAKTNVRASSSSRRASSVQVFAERKLWWVRDVFFFIRKSQAQARERAF